MSKPKSKSAGFVSEELGDDAPETTVATLDDGPQAESPELDPRDAEIAALKAENARLKATGAGFASAASGKYRVSLKDGPTAVVECGPGEHPWDTYKRVTGVISSEHAAQIAPQPAAARCGVCGPDGTVPEPQE